MKFRSDVDGFVTGVRFYKGAAEHRHARRQPVDARRHAARDGDLHRRDGVRLAAGRRSTRRSPITADTTYVASYHAPAGHYAADARLLRARASTAPPLHAPGRRRRRRQRRLPLRRRRRLPDRHLQRDQLLGRRRLRSARRRRTRRRRRSLAMSPADGAPASIADAPTSRARFNEAMDAATIDGSTFELRDAAATARRRRRSPTTPATRTATLTPSARAGVLDHVHGDGQRRRRRRQGPRRQRAGRGPHLDLHDRGAAAAAARPRGRAGRSSWSAAPANPFSRYYAEILRAEGLNAFDVTDLSSVTATTLAAYDVVILGEMRAHRRPGDDARRPGSTAAAT